MRAMEVFPVSPRSWVFCLFLFLSYLTPAAAQEPVANRRSSIPKQW